MVEKQKRIFQMEMCNFKQNILRRLHLSFKCNGDVENTIFNWRNWAQKAFSDLYESWQN